MKVNYALDTKDFVTHQLYLASKSERIKKKRKRNQFIVPLIYVALGLFLLFGDKTISGIFFFVVALLWFLIYPKWERRRYEKHYKAYVKENFKERFGRLATVEFNNDLIYMKDASSEAKIMTSELEEISEIPTAIIVRFKTGQGLIIPKDKIENINHLRERLQQIAGQLNISYSVEGSWKWK